MSWTRLFHLCWHKKTKFRIVTANIRNSKKTLVRFSIRVIHYSSSGFNQLQKIKRKPSQITSNFIAINNNNNTKSSLIQVLRTCNTLIRYLSSRYNQSLLLKNTTNEEINRINELTFLLMMFQLIFELIMSKMVKKSVDLKLFSSFGTLMVCFRVFWNW
jgi:hypothetical protein